MGKRRRKGPPPGVAGQISEVHFRLLQTYGKNPLPQKIGKQEQRKLWQMMCEGASVPHVDRELVVDAWKTYISGTSRYSSIAINGDVDPKLTTLGVAYHGKITAAHTIKTPALLKRVMRIFAKGFESRSDFLAAAERLCISIADKVFGEKK